MFPIRFKRPALLCMAMLTVVLSGCGRRNRDAVF